LTDTDYARAKTHEFIEAPEEIEDSINVYARLRILARPHHPNRGMYRHRIGGTSISGGHANCHAGTGTGNRG
jgi:hypothetical protein